MQAQAHGRPVPKEQVSQDCAMIAGYEDIQIEKKARMIKAFNIHWKI